MRLIQVRDCDGQCCRESPRFPSAAADDCLYREADGCRFRRDPAAIPDGDCPVNHMSAVDAVIRTCFQWPQNMPAGRSTGGCCWQWVE